MKRPEPRALLISVALVAIGSITGALLDRMSFPHVARLLNTCASSKQFLVEFRMRDGYSRDRIPGLIGETLDVFATMEVDGVRLGDMASFGPPIRRFLCEGNHQARIRFPGYDNHTAIHDVDFAVGRASLFHLTKSSSEHEPGTCVYDDPCSLRIGLELSPYEPDDPKVRLYPLDSER